MNKTTIFIKSLSLDTLFDWFWLCSFQQAEEDCSKAMELDKKVRDQAFDIYFYMQNILFLHIILFHLGLA